MKKDSFLFFLFSLFFLCSAYAGEGRYTIPLTGGGWSLWIDKEASWQNDRLYLPHVTLVNSYNGFNSAPSELHYVLDSYMTALNKGIEVHGKRNGR